MVGRTDSVSDIVVLQDFLQLNVTKVRTSITYQDSWDTKSGEYLLLEKLDDCLSIIVGVATASTHLLT